MFDDNTQNQPVQDTGVAPEPAPGGVLGPADTTTASTVAPDPAPAAPADPSPASDQTYNTTPVDASVSPAVDASADTNATVANAGGNDDLISLKQQALQSLSPLLNHLDQAPEEKFKTTMMMIQASDDQSLVKTAYEAAQSIQDEKAKAQALLDVVNEINYFTQQGQKSSN